MSDYVNDALLDASPYKKQADEAKALVNKWDKTGLLDGLNEDFKRQSMAVLLENQAKQLINEASSTSPAGGVAGGNYKGDEEWSGVALPLVRRIFGEIAAQEFVSVQPMNLPSGLVFYLDFQHGKTRGGFTSDDSIHGKTGPFSPSGSTAPFPDGGFYGAGKFGYTVGTGSVSFDATDITTAVATHADLNFNSEFTSSVNAGKIFKNTFAVNNINFSIEKNKTLGLLGPNGCGKTTSIGMMLGLITPTKGEILIDDKILNSKNRIELLSMMNFASPYIELPKKLTVRQNLEVYARLYGINNKDKRIDELIEDLNLSKFLYKNTGELSSGQKNRVSLAKSLINKPKLLFLDEPTASLDPDVGDFVRGYLENYKNKNQLTMLLASHNMKEVERLCNKVIMMKQGKIVDNGTCQELIKKHGRENLEDTFLKIARSKNEFK